MKVRKSSELGRVCRNIELAREKCTLTLHQLHLESTREGMREVVLGYQLWMKRGTVISEMMERGTGIPEMDEKRDWNTRNG